MFSPFFNPKLRQKYDCDPGRCWSWTGLSDRLGPGCLIGHTWPLESAKKSKKVKYRQKMAKNHFFFLFLPFFNPKLRQKYDCDPGKCWSRTGLSDELGPEYFSVHSRPPEAKKRQKNRFFSVFWLRALDMKLQSVSLHIRVFSNNRKKIFILNP